MRRGFAMGIIAVFTLAGSLAGRAEPLEIRGELRERYAPSADISGSPVLGLVALRAGEAAASRIVAQVPGSWAAQIVCARMVSSDGRYDASRPFGVPADWQGGIAELDIPTRYLAELDALDELELGVAVSMDDCSGQPDGLRIVPAVWGSTEMVPEIRLLINSFRADEAYLYIAARNADIACDPVATEARTAFDMVCPLPQDLLAEGGVLEVELNRVRRGAMMGSTYFTIELP